MPLGAKAFCLLAFIAVACTDDYESNAPIPTRFLIGKPDERNVHAGVLLVDELRKSETLRRKTAWQIVTELLTPTAATSDASFHYPAFLSYYERHDLDVIFPIFFREMSVDPRDDLNSIINKTFTQAANKLKTIPAWTVESYREWRDALPRESQQLGAFGLVRALYSSTLVKAVLQDYDTVARCENLSQARDNEDLRNSTNFSLCFRKELPGQSVTLKASWHRADLKPGVPVYFSTNAAFRKRLDSGQWDVPDTHAQPDESNILTVELGDGTKFFLTGLHIATKVLREWFWITLWWSPNASEDYGFDRPRDTFLETSVWRNYKMCTVVSYEDSIASDVSNETLRENQRAFHEKFSGRSWCSNPYLEKGPHNTSTNCIACHQHAGTGKRQEDILTGEENGQFERLDKVRKNFPTDYVYGITMGADHISANVRANMHPTP